MEPIYLDHASTTELKDEVFREMMPYLKHRYENPSSLYEHAIKNKKAINQSRAKIASMIHAQKSEIYFTSGGTEANNWALKGVAFKELTKGESKKNEIITTKIEHHSLTHTAMFLESIGYIVHYLDVDEQGFINAKQLEELLCDRTLIVSIILANNEIGVIQDIETISQICKRYNVLLHTDAVQAISHMQVNVKKLGIDLLSISAHKFNGPKGVGCLYIRDGIEVENLMHGGKQEQGKRSGTENVANMIGMSHALELALEDIDEKANRQRNLIRYLFDRIKNEIKDVKLNGPKIGSDRLPGNINLSFRDVDASIMCFLLNEKGIYVSTGSACNSGAIEPSHVLQAINVPEEYIEGTIRVSIGDETTKDEVNQFCDAVIEMIKNDLV